MEITFRRITPEDFEFLRRLHEAALKEYVELTWGWNEDWQNENFKQLFDPAKGRIVVIDGQDAGFLEVIEKESEIVLSSIRLLPDFQNKGAGTKIIRTVIARAKEGKRPVRLQVLKINPARRLYERLGFRIFEETETHFRMRLK
jgi:ribosomal protein S18 acetylase RimI-like enzyme